MRKRERCGIIEKSKERKCTNGNAKNLYNRIQRGGSSISRRKNSKGGNKRKNVHEDTVYMWVSKAKQGNLTGNNASGKSKSSKTSSAVDEQLEEANKKIKTLEQENAQLIKERDIL